MGFGFAKGFIIIVIIAIIFSLWTKNFWNGAVLVGIFAVIKIVFSLLTK